MSFEGLFAARIGDFVIFRYTLKERWEPTLEISHFHRPNPMVHMTVVTNPWFFAVETFY